MTTMTNPRDELDRLRFYIGGEWVLPNGSETIQAIEAATGEPIATAALGNDADIDAAVTAARQAFDLGPWGKTTAAERVQIIRRFADALAARADATSELVSRENGMPITQSLGANGAVSSGLLRMYADLVEAMPAEDIRPSLAGATVVRREPVGVVGVITPWNFPQLCAMTKIAPALAAGCTIVVKHSPETALDAYVFADAADEAGIPPGVLNIVLADRGPGQTLVSHPLVDKIAFTGSTAAGRAIGAECGRLIRRCSLELGGKSAAIFCDDAEIDTMLATLMDTTFLNGSQACTAQTRILAPRARYGEVVDALVQFSSELVIGDPLDPSTTMGPMASKAHLDRVLGYIDVARDSEARLVAGGGRPTHQPRGWFVEPTVFADVSNDDRLAREEVFGPVVAVIPFDSEDDAIRMANDSNYGLAGSVWSRDESRAVNIARQMRTGSVGVNGYQLDAGSPFGGYKDSGIGRELGPEGLSAYFEYKSMYVSSTYSA
jgi:aldehyde dehydrogenase (NAD+)